MKKLNLLIISLLILSSCGINQRKSNLTEAVYISNSGLKLKTLKNDTFELYNKKNTSYEIVAKGNIRKENNKLYISTYDSIVSDNIDFILYEYINPTISNDSILIEIQSPLLNNYKKSISSKSNNLSCKNNLVNFNILNRLNSDWNWEFSSSKLLIPNYNKLTYNQSFQLFVKPKLDCFESIKLKELWTEVLPVNNSKTNHIIISLPDLSIHRFNYKDIKDEELKFITQDSIEFMQQKMVKVGNVVN